MQKTYRKLLFDLDNTLIDDDENRRYAIRQILTERKENATTKRIESFIKMDNQFWKDRAEGKIKDPYIIKSNEEKTKWIRAQRFLKFFNDISFEESVEINQKYINYLGKNIIPIKNAYDILKYLYESKSHFALAYIALNDLIQNSKRNISICQNCGRYYLQYSGKEVYCELPNVDGSPTCKSYASRKAYDNKIEEDIAELTYKREYQRRITQVYRADSIKKPKMKKDFKNWKSKAREKLKLYRENKISSEEFCSWIEENKN